MTNEDLEKMKIYFNLLEAKNENYKKLINRKKELEEELLIKEYLCLLKEEAEYDGKILSNDDIVNKVISYSRISNTNNIYVYMGTYQRGSYSDIEHGPTDKRVARDNENADYRVYADIEKNSSDAYVEVPIEKCDDFEKENTILFSHQFISSDYYYSVKKMFFEEALKNGQEKAIQKVLSIR